MNRGALFGAQDAPSACPSFPESARMHEMASNVFRMSVRRFLASCVHIRQRNCANLRSKCARFCVQNFENRHDCGHRRTHEVFKRHPGFSHALLTRFAYFSELSDALCHEILDSKAVIFGATRGSFDEFRCGFGTRHAPSACKSFPGSARERSMASEVFGMSLRAFLAASAHVRHRKCANLRSQCARFCVQNFENQRDCGQRCTLEVHKNIIRSSETLCT